MSVKPPDDLFDDLPFFRAATPERVVVPPGETGRIGGREIVHRSNQTLTIVRQNEAPAAQVEVGAKHFQLAPRSISKAKGEMDAMSDSGVWTSARGVHLVALYSWLHTAVYGVEPAELDGKAWALASVMAQRFCAQHFEGDFAGCVEFMRWCWKREASREEWRRAHHNGGARIAWRLQFSAREEERCGGEGPLLWAQEV
jgi:hypothetical protein